GRVLTKIAADRVHLITVRDENSRKLLENLGVARPEIKVVSDPVMALAPAPRDRQKGLELLTHLGMEKALGSESSIIGVSVRSWPGSQVFMEGLAALCDDLARQGWQILFTPMHFPEDLKISENIAGMMENESYILDREIDLPLLLGVMSNLEFLMGMRLHSLVFAAVSGTPSIGISYDPKIDSFVEQIGQFNGGRVEDLDYRKFRDMVFSALDNLPQSRQTLLERVPILRNTALGAASLAMNLAGGRNRKIK
ncbi:MAG: polysaccharide pyruvyl transferase CsaB, partial [Clostridia bacterium]|nr:polysaccharide pyruvyl transferase CsaB [Clostridia bacterium]